MTNVHLVEKDMTEVLDELYKANRQIENQKRQQLVRTLNLLTEANARLNDLHMTYINSCTPKFTNDLADFKGQVNNHLKTMAHALIDDNT